MTPWLLEDTVLEWEWRIQMSPPLGSFLVIMKKLDVMLENSFMLIPLNWPYCLQMYNSPCIKCFEWICRSFFFFFTVMKNVEMNVSTRGSGTTVNPASCVLDRHRSLFTKDINNLSSDHWRWRGWCINDLLTFTLYLALCVCVCLCLPMSWLWRAPWPHCWVMRCLVWRLRTNKHSALFYSTHSFHAHWSVEGLCVCVELHLNSAVCGLSSFFFTLFLWSSTCLMFIGCAQVLQFLTVFNTDNQFQRFSSCCRAYLSSYRAVTMPLRATVENWLKGSAWEFHWV